MLNRRKKDLAAMEVRALVAELDRELSGAYISKVFQRNNRDILIRFSTKEGRKDLVIKDGKWIFLAENPGENPQTPGPFAMRLRKILDNARVEGIRQPGFERIIEMALSKREKYYLYVELFSIGNVVLTDENRNILAVLTSKKWKERVLKMGETYKLPPSGPEPPDKLAAERILEIMKESDADVIRTLITRLNLGPTYGEEILARSGVAPRKKAAEISIEECRRIRAAIKELTDEIDGEPEPVLVSAGNKPIDACPIPLKTYSNIEDIKIERKNTFSNAIEELLKSGEEEERESPEVSKILRQIERQEETLKKYSEDAEKLREMADYMYAAYAAFDRLLRTIREKWESSEEREFLLWAESEDILHHPNPKDKTVKADINGHTYTLYFLEDVNSNANRIYDTGKKLKEKAKRGEKAIEEARKRLENMKKEGKTENVRNKIGREKRFWFEKYRWFITSEGCLTIGGKDARGNEEVVAKRMKQGDRYVHADIHGAPSVVVKMSEACTEQSLKEAGQFSLCMSRAWAADIGSGSAYWVNPEQVSKTPQAGEFLAKGSFVIRGKRNYFKDLPLRLAVGIIEYQGEKKIVCAPVETMEAHTEEYLIITPGKRRKEDVAKEIARIFERPVDAVVSILPPGPSEIVEKRRF